MEPGHAMAAPSALARPAHPLIVREVPFQYPRAHKAAQGGDALRSSCLAQRIAALQRLEQRVPEEVHVSLEHLLNTSTAQFISNSATEMCTSHRLSQEYLQANTPDLRPAPSLQERPHVLLAYEPMIHIGIYCRGFMQAHQQCVCKTIS